MTKLTVLSPDDKLAEIRHLYLTTTKKTITEDLARAVQLLKSMNSEDERERATVYMDGLSQMRSDWAREGGGGQRAGKPKGQGPHTRPPGGGRKGS